MKKTNVSPLSEIVSDDIQTINNYVEDAFRLFAADLLVVNNGVVKGLVVSEESSGSVSVASGIIYHEGYLGELESASGSISIEIPTGAVTRIDCVVAYYEEIEDTPGSGYVLTDVTTRIEQIQTDNTRRLGAALITVLQDTTAGSVSSGYIVLAEVDVTSGGITAVDNTVKTASAVTNLSGAGTRVFESVSEAEAAVGINDEQSIIVRSYGTYVRYATSTEIVDHKYCLDSADGGRFILESAGVYLITEIAGV